MNPSFNKATALLAHPLSLAALALLLLNDHLLRRIAPTWWTGKLGDFAWLIFAPLVMAALFSWLLPRRIDLHARLTGWLAFGITGFVFVTVKMLPAVHGLATRISASFFGVPITVLRDPSDLLALPALALSAWLWSRPSTTDSSHQTVRAKGLVALPLAALLTIANMAAPNFGVSEFKQEPGSITATTGYQAYTSTDGGLTWKISLLANSSGGYAKNNQALTIAQGPREAVAYRFSQGGPIEISTDGGNSWQTGYDLTPSSEAEQQYYLQAHEGNPMFTEGPLDATADPISGNMLFAMGHQGVLVHLSSGEWRWVQVGSYRRAAPFPTPEAFSLLLGSEIYLAAELGLLIFAALALRWTRHILRIIAVALAWTAWLLVAILFPPPAALYYSETITAMGILGVALLAIPLVVEQAFRLARRAPGALLHLVGISAAGALLFFLPYLLWLYNALPSLTWAIAFSITLAVAVTAAGWMTIRQMHAPHPSMPPEGTG